MLYVFEGINWRWCRCHRSGVSWLTASVIHPRGWGRSRLDLLLITYLY